MVRTTWQPMRGSRCSVLRSRNVLLDNQPNEIINFLNKLSNSHITTLIYKNKEKNIKYPKGPKQIFCRVWFSLTRLDGEKKRISLNVCYQNF